MKCRHCASPLKHTFLDLGFAPPSNAYLTNGDFARPEKYYPLKVKVCDHCWLVQTEDYAQADELFSAEYAYFSSTSTGLEYFVRFHSNPSMLVMMIDFFGNNRCQTELLV